MDPICSKIAGGFSNAGSDCVVVIKIDARVVTCVVESIDPVEGPVKLLETLAEELNVDMGDMQVKVYGAYGGFDGAEMVKSYREKE